MARIGNLRLKGVSGKTYDFEVYTSGTTFDPALNCVFYLSKRKVDTSGGARHEQILIGQTSDLHESIKQLHREGRFEYLKSNAISILRDPNEMSRHEIEIDLSEREQQRAHASAG